jgi:alpha-mannosidase
MTRIRLVLIVVVAVCLAGGAARSQEPGAAQKPTLYLVSNSHLDTQWNWTVQDTIRELVPPTFFDNFKLFERFPSYTFNYEGAIHYMWFKEYFPEAWPTLQKYVASGRWRLAGSWVNAADTHVPSPESLMRQALYGKRFYRQEFGTVSQDIYLPDCFGFGFALPSIGAHSGLTAFSTQKLSWGAARPAPFAVGRWTGVDGSSLVASLRGGDYTTRLRSDVSTDPKWTDDLVDLGGRKVGFRYFGVGDIGGAPDEESVQWMEKAVGNKSGAVQVRSASADQLARDLSAAERAALPEYTGELLLKTHGVGCYTSQAAMKTWNRRNEQLADAAERAAVAAEWLGGPAYPRDRLRAAWTRFLWHQFHDDLTGTSVPQAYRFSWNDELLSLNQFASILQGSVASVGSGMDTRPLQAGIPIVVYNPLAMVRRDVVEATVGFRGQAPATVRVVDTTTGQEVPAQVLSTSGASAKLLFIPEMPGVGFKVFEVRPGTGTGAARSLKVSTTSLENNRYVVTIDGNGDVSSIVDKEAGSELLQAPVRLAMFDNYSPSWPAWEILWEAVSVPPREHVDRPAVRVVERGPARVAVEIRRIARGSTFVQRVRLAEGGDRVEFEHDIDWRTPGTLLKASFPFKAANPTATYDLGLGTVDRPNASASTYEVPGQQWADITDTSGRFGAAVLNDAKYGWDKPSDHELRLTLIHTPMPKNSFVYQGSNDIGRHRFTHAIAGHAGGWRQGRIPASASRLNQPVVAFQADAHAGPLGRSLSLLEVSDSAGQVAVRAMKKAEDSDEIVVRVQELYGQAAERLEIGLPEGIAAAREINAAEEAVGPATVSGGRLVTSLRSYQPRTFAITPGRPASQVPAASSTPVVLPYDLDGFSADAAPADGDFDGRGLTLPAELVPPVLDVNGVGFRFGPTAAGALNVMSAKGQRIPLPAGAYNRLYLLATAVGGDTHAALTIERAGAAPVRTTIPVQEWAGAIGQWDSRLADDGLLRKVFIPDFKRQTWPLGQIESQMVARWQPGQTPAVSGLDQIRPGFVKRDELAWLASHRHDRTGNQPYIPGYVFRYGLDLPKGARALVLPRNAGLRVLAVSVAIEPASGIRPAGALYATELPPPGPTRGAPGRQRGTGPGSPAIAGR